MDKNKTGSLQTIVCLQTPGFNLEAEPDVSDLHDSLQGGYVTIWMYQLVLKKTFRQLSPWEPLTELSSVSHSLASS